MTEITIDHWLRVLQILVLLVSVGVNVFLFIKARTDERFKAFDERLTGLANQKRQMAEQIALVERTQAVHDARLGALPTHKDLTDIRQELTGLKAHTAAISERSETTLETVQSIQTYLMENR